MEPTPNSKDRQVAEVLGQLRKDLQQQLMSELRRSSTLIFDPRALPPAPHQLSAIDEELRQNMIQAGYHYQTARWIPDHRFAYGRPLLKKIILRLLSFYTDRQTQFNKTVVRTLNGLHGKLASAFQRAERQEQEHRELRALIENLSERYEQELRELRARIAELSDRKARED